MKDLTIFERIDKELMIITQIFEFQIKGKKDFFQSVEPRYLYRFRIDTDIKLLRLQEYKKHYTTRFESTNNSLLINNELTEIQKKTNAIISFYNKFLSVEGKPFQRFIENYPRDENKTLYSERRNKEAQYLKNKEERIKIYNKIIENKGGILEETKRTYIKIHNEIKKYHKLQGVCRKKRDEYLKKRDEYINYHTKIIALNEELKVVFFKKMIFFSDFLNNSNCEKRAKFNYSLVKEIEEINKTKFNYSLSNDDLIKFCRELLNFVKRFELDSNTPQPTTQIQPQPSITTNTNEFSVLEWATIFYYADNVKMLNGKTLKSRMEQFMTKHNITTTYNRFKNEYYEARKRTNELNNYPINKLELITPFLEQNYKQSVTILKNDIEYLKNEKREDIDY